MTATGSWCEPESKLLKDRPKGGKSDWQMELRTEKRVPSPSKQAIMCHYILIILGAALSFISFGNTEFLIGSPANTICM